MRSKAKVLIFNNAKHLNAALIEDLARVTAKWIAEGRDPALALPTGNTMISFYAEACKQEVKLNLRHWRCFNLDEYYPVTDANQHLSFQNYMRTHFYSKLKIAPREQEMLNGRALDLFQECVHFENKLQQTGGIDLALLGLGRNGHIAFNEPGSELNSRTRAVALRPETLKANFKGEVPFTHAMTLGMGNLLEAKEIRIVALGRLKSSAVKAALREPQTLQVPASALQSHPQVTWYLDEEAASLLS